MPSAMSGLLVKSTLIMKDNLDLMNERGINGAGYSWRRRFDAPLRRRGFEVGL